MQLILSISKDSNAQQKLDKLQRSLMDWEGAMAIIGAAFKAYYSSVPFVSRGTVYGEEWADYQIDGYESWKADEYPGRGLLMLTGTMSESFDFMTTSDSVKLFNTDEDKFAAHQLGIGHPQRVMMALNKERRDTAADIMMAALNQKVEAL